MASAGGQATKRRSDAFAARVLPISQAIRAEGHTSLTAVARQLHARGVATDRGGKWTSTSIKNLLARSTANVIGGNVTGGAAAARK